MIAETSILVLVNLGAIALLPRVFFRRGRLNRMWFLTASPFALAATAHVAVIAGLLDPLAGSAARIAGLVAIPLSAASIALIGATVGCHRIPLALWHQADDVPVEIVTWGPYRHVRHPFYAAFLLALTASLLAGPHLVTAAALVTGAAAMATTARREERRLVAGALGTEYAAYGRRTGRFVPRIGALA